MPVYSVEAPVGGWNARDSRDNLPESDALELVNLIPKEGFVESRGGFDLVWGFISPDVDTLMSYESGSTTDLLSASGERVFRINDPAGTASVTELGSGFASADWQHTVTHGLLLMVNGSDAPQEYDGTTLSAISGIGGSGLTVSDLYGLMPFKGRVFYWEDNATSFWYPGAGEYKNASMSEYDMAQFLTKGGKLVCGFSWTLDAGSGVDDLAVFVFSTGETLVYQGSDPGSASDWALIGRFQIGEPLGVRAHCQLASDHVVLTKDGYELISSAIQSGRTGDPLSDKISGAVADATDAYGDNDYWHVTFYPAESLLLVSVPIDPAEDEYEAHVLNINTGAWCKFSVFGRCSVVSDSRLYIGNGAFVLLYDNGVFKEGITGATDIAMDATQITHLGSRGVRKQLTGINFLTTHQDQDEIGVTTAADFNTPSQPSVNTVTTTGGTTTTQRWRIMAEVGYAISYRLRCSEQGQRWKWYATQMTYKRGGPL